MAAAPNSKANVFIKPPSKLSYITHGLVNRGTGGLAGAVISVKLSKNVVLPIEIPRRAQLLGFAVVGFGTGFTVITVCKWLRLYFIRKLLMYNGWIYKPKAKSTKLWGLLLKLFAGPGPHTIFDFEEVLPSLPLPTIDNTCERYLNSVQPLLSEEDYEETKRIVQKFKTHEAPKLHKYLEKRYKTFRNYMADIWLDRAYLLQRMPLAMNVSFYIATSNKPEVSTQQLARAANCIYGAMLYYEAISNEKLPPDMIQGVVPVCMDGVRCLFSTTRIPGETIDSLKSYPNSRHIIVISKGQYYRMEMYAHDKAENMTLLSRREIHQQLEFIKNDSRDIKEVNKVAALTSQDRTTWAKQREKLLSNPTNMASLEDVESAILIFCLGSYTPKTIRELGDIGMKGDGTDRWFDKSLCVHICKDTTMGVSTMEHTGADATYFVIMWERTLKLDEWGPDGNLPVLPGETVRLLPFPRKLNWDLDYMQDEIQNAYDNYQKVSNDLDMNITHTKVGKKWLKQKNFSPDGFLQMLIQLTNWRLHKEMVKTYESASTRLFAFGRTENANPVTMESKAWVVAMEDPSIPKDTKIKMLRNAIEGQRIARLDATCGNGCDRHMLAMFHEAEAQGEKIPAVYKDKAWHLPMKLSTSNVPTQLGQIGLPIVNEHIIGGFGPSCPDGYGIMYACIDDNLTMFNTTCWKSKGKSADKFAETLTVAFDDMVALVEEKNRSKSNGAAGTLNGDLKQH